MAQSTSSTGNQPLIELRHVDKHYGDLHVLNDINLSVDRGEVVRQQVPETKGTVGSVAFERDLAAGEHEVRLFCKDRLPAIDVLNVTSVK